MLFIAGSVMKTPLAAVVDDDMLSVKFIDIRAPVPAIKA